MKRLIYIPAIVFMISLMSLSAEAQAVVRLKPKKPNVVVVKCKRPSLNHVWTVGHWKWDVKRHSYTWVKGKWQRTRTGYAFVGGHWSRARS